MFASHIFHRIWVCLKACCVLCGHTVVNTELPELKTYRLTPVYFGD